MELSTRQLSSLNEMGIPVWEFRTEKVTHSAGVDEAVIPAELYEYIAGIGILLIVDTQYYQVAEQRLLNAMLFSVGLSFEHIAIVNPHQFLSLDKSELDLTSKKIMVLGRDLLDLNADQSKRMKVSMSLTELLNKPADKAIAWRDLQFLKS